MLAGPQHGGDSPAAPDKRKHFRPRGDSQAYKPLYLVMMKC